MVRNSRYRGLGKIAMAAVFLIVICSGIFISWLALYSNTPGPSGARQEAVVIIPRGSSFKEISRILAESGLITADIRFEILARWKNLAGRIHAGEFVLPTGKLPMELLEELIRARARQHPVTIPEGLRAREIAAIFEQGDWCSREKFLELVHDSGFIKGLGMELSSLEGYLYPDTYHLTRYPEFDAEKIVKMMVNRFFEVWEELESGDAERHEAVILASIVEKETGSPDERARIASVFHNRLAKGMRLQSDPTVIYGIDDFSGDITRKDLRNPTPYNTYVISGLPAGPICSPGKAALQAVLNPAQEDYLYFVSRNDGTHLFSKTLKEHNRAVFQYQRKKQ